MTALPINTGPGELSPYIKSVLDRGRSATGSMPPFIQMLLQGGKPARHQVMRNGGIDPITKKPIQPLGAGQPRPPAVGPVAANPGITDRLDSFLNKPSGSLLMNLLAQSGYSPIPQSPGGSIGRALLATQQQGQARGDNKLKRDLILSQINKNNRLGKAGITSPFGLIDRAKYTKESVADFEKTGRQSDLVLRAAERKVSSDESRFNFFETLDDEQKRAFLAIQRAAPRPINVAGAGLGTVDPVSREFIESVPESVIQQGIGDRKESEAGGSVRGSSTEQRIQDLPKTVQAAEQTIRGIDNVIDEVSRGLKLVGPSTTGSVGALLKFLPGTDAFSLDKIRVTIKSNIGFDKLNEMRRVSPTGASGLGQLSTIELDGLQNGLTNLDQAQSTGDVKRALTKVLDHYESWKQIMQQHIFDEQRRAGATDALPPGFREAQ